MTQYKKSLSDFLSKSKNKDVIDIIKLISFKDGFFYSNDDYCDVLLSKNNFTQLKNKLKLKKITFDVIKNSIKVGNTAFFECSKTNNTVDDAELNNAIIESIKKSVKAPGDLSEYWWDKPDLFFENSSSFIISKSIFKKVLGNTSKYNFYSDSSPFFEKLNDVSKYVKNRPNLICVLKSDENKILSALNKLSKYKYAYGPFIEIELSEFLNHKKLELFNILNLTKNSKIAISKPVTEFEKLKVKNLVLEKDSHSILYTDGVNKIELDVNSQKFKPFSHVISLNSKKYQINKSIMHKSGFKEIVTIDWIGASKDSYFTKINSSKISTIGKWLKTVKSKVTLKEFSSLLMSAKTDAKKAEELFVFLQRLEFMSFLANSDINFVISQFLYKTDKIEQLRTTTIS